MKRYFSAYGSASNLAKPDINTRPQDNLYLTISSEWFSKVKTPADRTSTRANLILDVRIEDKLMKDFAEFANGKKPLPNIANFEKAINYYKLTADFDKRNKDQTESIKKDLSRLASLKNFEELNQEVAQLISSGYELPFDIYVSEDMKNTDYNALYATGPQLSLPDTAAYQVPDAEKLPAVLGKQTVKLLIMAGISEEQTRTWAKSGVKFDKKLPKILRLTEEWVDEVAMYNPASLSDFEAKFDQFNTNSFLKRLLPEMPEEVITAEPRYFNRTNDFLSESEFEELKSWIVIKFINKSATYLSQDFREAAFPFGQAIYGVPELPSQDKHAYRLTSAAFDEAIGIYYGKTYLGDEAKAGVISMIRKMLKVYEQRIQGNIWLSEPTKRQAIIKLKALKLKVGYPEENRALFDNLVVDPNKTLYENHVLINQERIKDIL